MTAITWDDAGKHFYETGVDHGVLYVQTPTGAYGTGVAWNGLTAVTESPSGAEPTAIFADNIKYLNLLSLEEFAATIEAYTYPDEFGICDGTASPVAGLTVGQQPRRSFGLCYRTKIGNDVESSEHGYKLHLIYNAMAAPSEKAYATVNDSPEAITFSWSLSTTAVPVTGYKNTSLLTLDSRTLDPAKLTALEAILYGSASSQPTLPSPDGVISALS